jgi:hypothetical protein
MTTAADFLVGKLDAMDDDMRRIAVTDLSHSWLMRMIQSGEIKYDLNSADAANLARGQIAVPFAALAAGTVKDLGLSSGVVSLSVRDAGEIGATTKAYGEVQRMIETGAFSRDGDRITLTGPGWRATIRVEEGGGLYLEALDRGKGPSHREAR